MGWATEPCDAHEDVLKWGNTSQLAMYEKVEYIGGGGHAGGGGIQRFQKGDQLLAWLLPGQSLKLYSTRTQNAHSTVRHDEMWGEVCFCRSELACGLG